MKIGVRKARTEPQPVPRVDRVKPNNATKRIRGRRDLQRLTSLAKRLENKTVGVLKLISVKVGGAKESMLSIEPV